MRVVISTMEPDSNAHKALLAEGVPHTEHVCQGKGYSEMLARLWREGEGFILVERDIAPWVGAVRQLEKCEQDRCAFWYAWRGRSLVRSLGLTKFSGRLLRAYPDLANEWDGCELERLEEKMLGSISRVAGLPHTHEPPVARVRGLD